MKELLLVSIDFNVYTTNLDTPNNIITNHNFNTKLYIEFMNYFKFF